MKSTTRIAIDEATSTLRKIQGMCIGVYRSSMSRQVELVLEKNGDSLLTVHIGSLFGMATDYNAPIKRNKFVPFPDGKTLSQMMESVTEFHQWYTENFK